MNSALATVISPVSNCSFKFRFEVCFFPLIHSRIDGLILQQVTTNHSLGGNSCEREKNTQISFLAQAMIITIGTKAGNEAESLSIGNNLRSHENLIFSPVSCQIYPQLCPKLSHTNNARTYHMIFVDEYFHDRFSHRLSM